MRMALPNLVYTMCMCCRTPTPGTSRRVIESTCICIEAECYLWCCMAIFFIWKTYESLFQRAHVCMYMTGEPAVDSSIELQPS